MSFKYPVFPFLVRRLGRVSVIFLLLIVLGLGAALALGDGELVTLVHFSSWVQGHYELVRAITDYGLYPFYVVFVVMLVYGLARNEPWLKLMAMAYVLAQLLGSVAVVRAMKMVFGRARPDASTLPGFESQWVGFTWDAKFHSFPSGHTADIVTSAVFMALMIRSPWAAGLFMAWAVFLAITRLALAKHYPTDAVVGAAIALAACYLVVRYWLMPRLERPPPFPVPRWWQGG